MEIEKKEPYERAAVEGQALEGGGEVLGLGSAPLRRPFSLGDEQPVLAVLLLPHLLESHYFTYAMKEVANRSRYQ